MGQKGCKKNSQGLKIYEIDHFFAYSICRGLPRGRLIGTQIACIYC
jgi:hypothetical protein